MLKIIGSTPIVRLANIPPPRSAEIIVKLEYYNPTGSYKDRMALAMIEEAEKRGDLRPGMPVVEYTSGSTGSSLALVCALKGYPFYAISSDAFAKEKIQTMLIFGAKVIVIPSKDRKVTPDLVPRMIKKAQEIIEKKAGFGTDQFNNTDAIKGYMSIGRELLIQSENKIDAFCGGVGTAGMLMGVSTVLKKALPEILIVALEPASSPVISRSKVGSHKIEGIGVGFIPPLLDLALIDRVRAIKEEDARRMAQRLAKEEGIFAGTSTGVNVLGALALAKELGYGKTVATVAVDTGFKYIAGDLYTVEGEIEEL